MHESEIYREERERKVSGLKPNKREREREEVGFNNHQMHGFSFRVFEDEIEVQDVISPLSLDQILISSIPWTRKRVKNMKKSNWHLNWCLDNSNFSKVQGRVLPSRRTRI